ncbi:MAG: hypothetical protein ACE366_17830 [Bradymonadia bacterium]
MKVDRRTTLKGLMGFAAGLVTATPRTLRASIFDLLNYEPDDLTRLREVLASARTAGRPALILVVPDDRYGVGYDRGRVWGEFFMHAGPDLIAPLALCDIIAARRHTLQQVFPDFKVEDPLLVRVDTDTMRAYGMVDALELGTPSELRRLFDDADPDPRPRASKLLPQVYGAQLNFTGRQMLATLQLPDRLDVYVAQATVALGEEAEMIRAALSAGETLGAEQIEAGAALVYQAVTAREAPHWMSLKIALAELVYRRTRDHKIPVRSALWAVRTHCGEHVEHPDPVVEYQQGQMCGLGYVPDAGRRFLNFYALDDKW